MGEVAQLVTDLVRGSADRVAQLLQRRAADLTAVLRVVRSTLSASTWPERSLATETRWPESAAFAAAIASSASSLPLARRRAGRGL